VGRIVKYGGAAMIEKLKKKKQYSLKHIILILYTKKKEISIQPHNNLQFTVNVPVADIVPTALSASQLYSPSSSKTMLSKRRLLSSNICTLSVVMAQEKEESNNKIVEKKNENSMKR
jgi:hypothetical protein